MLVFCIWSSCRASTLMRNVVISLCFSLLTQAYLQTPVSKKLQLYRLLLFHALSQYRNLLLQLNPQG